MRLRALFLFAFCICSFAASAQTVITSDGLAAFCATNTTGGGGGGTCPADGSPTVAQAGAVNFLKINSDEPYCGMIYTNGPTSTNLCKVMFNLTTATDWSGSTVSVRLYALSGTSITPGSPLAETASISTSSSWDTTPSVVFTFASPPVMSANTQYAIVVTGNGGVGTGQYVQTFKGTTTISGRGVGWDASGTSPFDPQDGNCVSCALYMY